MHVVRSYQQLTINRTMDLDKYTFCKEAQISSAMLFDGSLASQTTPIFSMLHAEKREGLVSEVA